MLDEIIPIIMFAYKMLPSIISFFLSWGIFSFTMVARGIEADKETCENFDDVKAAKFPCLNAGITVLSVVIAAINLGISVITISNLSGLTGIAQGGTFFGVVEIFICFIYILKYDTDAFKMHKILPDSNWGLIRRMGKNPGLWANGLCLIGLSLYQIHIISILPTVANGI